MSRVAPAAEATVANDFQDLSIIPQIFKSDETKVLIWDGFEPDGRKKQFWKKGKVDWQKQLSGSINQGANLAYKNSNGELVCKVGVIDIDAQGEGSNKRSLSVIEVCTIALKANTKLIPFGSPRGNWHFYYFFNNETPVKEANKILSNITDQIKKLKINVDKVLPTANGSQCGINFPTFSNHQIPYDPRGNRYNSDGFLNRLRFNNYPLTSTVIGLKEGTGSRYQALCMAAAELNTQNKYSEERIKQINNTFDPPLDNTDSYLKRILEDEIFKDYKIVNEETVSEWIKQFVSLKEYQLPDDPEEPELEVFEHTGAEPIEPRKWVISGWLMEKCLTILAGQPGIGKTIILHMLAYCLSTGTGFFGKPIYRPGNVLLIAAEETLNEINIRLAAIHKFLGGEYGKFKIYKRGLEQDLKLVKFNSSHAEKTKQYKQLVKLIRKLDIKHIILDPLINFQQGNYDENSNQHMEEYVKNTLIPLTFINAGTLIAGHHTNKLSMIRIDDDSKDIEIDPQSALTAPRGASSLVGAARFVIAMQPMLKKIWNKFKEHVKDGSNFIHYTGIIEAKSNYNLVADDIAWLKKNTIEIPAIDSETKEEVTEKTGVFSLSTLSDITKNKLKLKAAENELYVRNNMPLIKAMFDQAGEDKITLNSVVVQLLGKDPRMAEKDIKESTIKTDIRRKLINGLGGAELGKKDQYERTGISYEDGYNYWYSVEKNGTQDSWFIERGKNFSKL